MSQHYYKAQIIWTGNTGQGTSDYRSYLRNHSIKIDGKPDIMASSDPQFRGDAQRHNPEEMFVSALSSCHMLWYLHLCADNHILVTAYEDEAIGTMAINPDGSGQFTTITLNPIVTVKDATMIEKAIELHHEAHQNCFLANSVNFPVTHRPSVSTELEVK